MRDRKLLTSTRTTAVVLFALLGVASLIGSVRAYDRDMITLDEWLVSPDAWIVGTVSALGQKPDPADSSAPLVAVSLTDVVVVAARVRADVRELTMRGVVSGTEDGNEGANHIFAGHAHLNRGSRYLFSLRGGEWVESQFVFDPIELDDVGARCGRAAYYYSFGVRGPVCGNARNTYGTPLTAEAFLGAIQTLRARGERRSAHLAARYGSNAQALVRDPLPLATRQGGPQ